MEEFDRLDRCRGPARPELGSFRCFWSITRDVLSCPALQAEESSQTGSAETGFVSQFPATQLAPRCTEERPPDRQDRSSRHESHIRRFILVVRVACYAPPIHPTAIDSWLGFEQ